MLYACDSCLYLFPAPDNEPVEQCPDCGKKTVRPATREECREYESRRTDDLWKGTKDGNG